MEYTPPPFFRQGPSALARLVAFAALSMLLLVMDARFKMLERVRFGLATVLYPMQRAARAGNICCRDLCPDTSSTRSSQPPYCTP